MLDSQSTQSNTADIEKRQRRKGKTLEGIIYVSTDQNEEVPVKGPIPTPQPPVPGWIVLTQAIVVLIAGVLALFVSLSSLTGLPPILINIANAFTAIFTPISAGFRQVGPLIAATIVLLAGVYVRLLAERFGLFVTPPLSTLMREPTGLLFLIVEIVLSFLLLLPLIAWWVSTFYMAVPAWALLAFGFAYIVTMFLALVPANGVLVLDPQNRNVVAVGQFISVVSGLATIFVFTAQTGFQTPSPLDSPWIVAIMVLLATVALRILAESLGFVNTYIGHTIQQHLVQIIEAFLLLAPLAAVWIAHFLTTVPGSALVGFGVAYLATVFVSHILCFAVLHLPILLQPPRSAPSPSGRGRGRRQ
jgi:hypothetical protein